MMKAFARLIYKTIDVKGLNIRPHMGKAKEKLMAFLD